MGASGKLQLGELHAGYNGRAYFAIFWKFCYYCSIGSSSCSAFKQYGFLCDYEDAVEAVKSGFASFLLGMMIPVYAMIVPLFSMFNKMHLLNTHLAVIIPHIGISFPMAIFIMSGFMGALPKEMEEAAVMDGCNIYQIFFKIIMPISQSSIVTVAVVTFINIWNDLLLPQIFLTDSSKMTLPVGLTEFQGQYTTNYVVEIAAVIITIIPSIIVYIWLHKHIMEGMVAGAVKG